MRDRRIFEEQQEMKIKDEIYYDIFRRVLAGLFPDVARYHDGDTYQTAVDDATKLTNLAVKRLEEMGVVESEPKEEPLHHYSTNGTVLGGGLNLEGYGNGTVAGNTFKTDTEIENYLRNNKK
jgi:hypothetical protein